MKCFIRSIPLSVATLLFLGACDSNNTDPAEVSAQAIDGYIVGGGVYCDSVANGQTMAGGYLTCPADTVKISVRGGADVGFDENATTGDILFVGELSAPSHLGYVTPLSTMAIIMSSDDDEYDPSQWEESVANLEMTLNQTSLDLSADASTDVQLVKLNAQINQIIAAYVTTEEDYLEVAEVFADLLEERAIQGADTDLGDNLASTMTDINESLANSNSDLALSQSELDESVVAVQEVNIAIAESTSPELVAIAAVESIVELASVSFERSNNSVSFLEENSSNVLSVSIDDFENSSTSEGRYNTVVTSELSGINYDSGILQFNKSFYKQRVTMAFEIKAVDADDHRSLSFYTSDVYVSAEANDSNSLELSMPSDATFSAHSASRNGSSTATQIQVNDAATFSSEGGSINVTFGQVNARLTELGFDDILDSSGNFEMTLVLNGLHVNEVSGSSTSPAQYYSIGSGRTRTIGAGFQGYLSVVR